MSDELSTLPDRVSLEDAEWIDEICDDFEAACRAGKEPTIEEVLNQAGAPIRAALLRELLAAEVEQRFRQGQRPQPGDYFNRFPDQTLVIGRVFAELCPANGAGADRNRILSGEGTEPGSGIPLEPANAPLPTVPGYEIEEELGRGGMGVVYKARALRLNRIVALKMILAGAHAGPKATLRFLNEAEVVARLRHPNIVQIFGVGDHDGRPYVELEYVAGGNLARKLDGTPRAAASAAALVEVLARAVQAAHSQGIIHRDLKPANVLLTPEGEPKIADFGLAKASDSDIGLTGSDAVLGTPSYMAPEQAEEGGRSVGPAADVYALGAIFYELLTGRPPFKAASVFATLEQVRTAEPLPPSRLEPGLARDAETICLKCLRKDPSHRYASARDLADDLRRWIEGEPVIARPVGKARRIWLWCRRRPGPAALTAAVAALAVTILLGAPIMLVRLQRERDESRLNLKKSLEAQGLAEQRIIAISLEQARALRLSHHVGQRVQSLAALGQAARLLPRAAAPGPTPQILRNEVILSLALVDLVAEERPLPPMPAYGTAVAVDDAFSRYAYPDGEDVVVSALDDGRELLRLRSPVLHSTCESLRFSPDGTMLSSVLTPSADSPHHRFCAVWSLAGGRTVLRIDVSGASAAFSRDNQCLAFVAPGGSVAIVAIATGALRRRFEVATTGPPSFAFDASGRQIAIRATEDSVKIFDVATGATTATLNYEGPIHTLKWRADGRLLAAAGWEERVHVWELPEGRLVSILAGHTGAVTGAVFRNKDGLLATWSLDGTTRLWDPVSGSELLSAPGAICGLSPDEERLAVQDNRRIGVWRIEGALECRTLHHGNTGNLVPRTGTVLFHSVDYSPDGRILAASGHDGVRLWDGSTARELAHLPIGPTQTLQFLPDGTALLTLGQSGLECWPINRTQGDGPPALRVGPPRILERTVNPVYNYAALSRDGKTLAFSVHSGRVTVLNLAREGAADRIDHLAANSLRSVAVSNDGRWTACGHWRSSPAVQVWDNTTGQVTREFDGEPTGATSAFVAFSPDGRWLVTCEQGVYRFWHVGTWQPGPRIERDQVEPYPGPIAWSRDGQIIAVAQSSTGVLLLDSARGEQRATLRANSPRAVRSLDFSPDGRRLAVANIDQQVIIWDLPRVRRGLADLGLDWSASAIDSFELPGPATPGDAAPPAVELNLQPQ
jgi:WD40 repeat protein/tRNA A-37 threonylcarbamoyl transferase component Bud32